MDPRVFFKRDPSTTSTSPNSFPLSAAASSTDDTSDLSHCRYSSYYSTQCVNGHCDTVKKQFRQCDTRSAEELVVDDNGQPQWQPTDEAAMRLANGSGLTADVSWPDPVSSVFDELRTQTQLIGDAFRQWDDQHSSGNGRSSSKRDIRDDGTEQQRDGPGNIDGGIGGLMDGMLNVLHGMSRDFVDTLFDRVSHKPNTPQRSDDESSGDLDDEL